MPTDNLDMALSVVGLIATGVATLIAVSLLGGASIGAVLGSHGHGPFEGRGLALTSPPLASPLSSAASTPVPIGPIMTSTPVKQALADPLNGTFLLLSGTKTQGNFTGLVRDVSDRTYNVVAHYRFPANGSPNMTLDPATGEVYLTNLTNTVTVLSGDALRPVATVLVPALASHAVYDAGNGNVYVAHACPYPGLVGTTNLTVIDGETHAVVTSVPVPCDPTALLANPTNGNVFLLTGQDGNLTVVSGANDTVLATVPDVGGTALRGTSPIHEMVYDPSDGDVFVSCLTSSYEGCISVLDGTSGALLATVDAGATIVGPFAVDPRGDVDYLAGAASSGLHDMELFALSGTSFTISPEARLGCFADALAMNWANDALYALGHCGNTAATPGTLFMLSATSYALEAEMTAATHSIFRYASSVEVTEVDPVTGDVLVAFSTASGGSTVAIFGPFPVTVSATVDALGLNWTASLAYASGYVESAFTEGSSLTFWLPNGSYEATLSVPGDFWESLHSATLLVHGGPVSLHATFSWAWWGWAVLLLSVIALPPGWVAARRARARARASKEVAAARLRWDLEHPLVPDPGHSEDGHRR